MKRGTGQVRLKQVEGLRIASLRSEQQDRSRLHILFERLYQACGDAVNGPGFSLLYHDSGLQGLDMEVCVPVAADIEKEGVCTRDFSGGKVLSIVHQGAYDRPGEAYHTIVRWALEHGINVENLSREVYISSKQNRPGESLTEVQLFVLDWEDRLAREVESRLGREACLAVMRGYENLPPDADIDQRALWVHTAVHTLDRLTGSRQTCDILSRCAHTFSRRRINHLRSVYLQAGSVDDVLESMHEDPDWYENPERQGDTILVTKVPADRRGYERAVSRQERRESYCHCALAYRHLDTMPPAFCNCGAGWYRQLWEGILGRTVRVEIIKCLTRMDETCRFAIHLSDRMGPE